MKRIFKNLAIKNATLDLIYSNLITRVAKSKSVKTEALRLSITLARGLLRLYREQIKNQRDEANQIGTTITARSAG